MMGQIQELCVCQPAPSRAQIAKHMFFAENTFVLAKGYKHICSASTQKVSNAKSELETFGPRFNMFQARVIC